MCITFRLRSMIEIVSLGDMLRDTGFALVISRPSTDRMVCFGYMPKEPPLYCFL